MPIRKGIPAALLILFVVACEPSANTYHAEGLVEYRAGRYDKARAMFKAALLQSPEKQESGYYLARCCRYAAQRKFDQGDITGAMRELDNAAFYYGQCIESYPGYTAAVEEKGQALKLKGRYAEALRLSLWAKDNAGRTVRQLVNVALEYEEQGDMDECLTTLRQAIAVEPDSALAHAELGRFFARRGRYDEAAFALERAYELSPSEPGVPGDLARCRRALEEGAEPAPVPAAHEFEN